MLSLLHFLVFWILVPLILKTGLVLSWLIVRDAQDEEAQISGAAGVIAGLIVGATCAILQFPELDAAIGVGSAPHFSDLAVIVTGVVGVMVGVGVPLIVLLVERTILAGLVTLLLSASSSVASVNYYFNSQAKNTVMILAVAAFFGALLHFIISPRTLGKILSGVSYGMRPNSVR